MELLLLIFVIVIVSSIVDAAAKAKTQSKDTVYVPKVCPPHKWKWLEIKDQDGNTAQWRMICEICGPIKPQDGPARLG